MINDRYIFIGLSVGTCMLVCVFYELFTGNDSSDKIEVLTNKIRKIDKLSYRESRKIAIELASLEVDYYKSYKDAHSNETLTAINGVITSYGKRRT